MPTRFKRRQNKTSVSNFAENKMSQRGHNIALSAGPYSSGKNSLFLKRKTKKTDSERDLIIIMDLPNSMRILIVQVRFQILIDTKVLN